MRARVALAELYAAIVWEESQYTLEIYVDELDDALKEVEREVSRVPHGK